MSSALLPKSRNVLSTQASRFRVDGCGRFREACVERTFRDFGNASQNRPQPSTRNREACVERTLRDFGNLGPDFVRSFREEARALVNSAPREVRAHGAKLQRVVAALFVAHTVRRQAEYLALQSGAPEVCSATLLAQLVALVAPNGRQPASLASEERMREGTGDSARARRSVLADVGGQEDDGTPGAAAGASAGATLNAAWSAVVFLAAHVGTEGLRDANAYLAQLLSPADAWQPLLDVRLLDSGDWNVQTTPHLRQLLERAAPMRDAHTLVRLLALTHALLKLNTLSGQSFRCLDLVECSLKDASAVAAIDRQLTALRAGPAARSASEGWQRGCTPWRCMCASYVHHARQQGNLAMIAAHGYGLACMEYGFRPDVGRALVEEADAAMAACKAWLPEQWVEQMRRWRIAAHAARQAHGSGQPPPSADELIMRRSMRCSGCGELSIELRARFCSRECAVRSWPAHKAACKAAARAAGRAGGQGGAASGRGQAGEEQG
eukprot:scaffold10.g2397.t1